MKTTLKMSVPSMVDFLTGIGTTSQFFSAETTTCLTEKGKRKLTKDCPFETVIKKAVVNGWLNIDYKAAIERKVSATLGVKPSEVEYTLGETWHTPYMPDGKITPIRVNKTKNDGKFYLYYFPSFSKATKEKTKYFDGNGNEIAYETLKPYFYAKSADSEFKPAVRCVTLNNIAKLKARGLIVVKR